jgi:hypothetical protein
LAKPKFVEGGKIGCMSNYNNLMDEDIIAAEAEEYEYEDDPDDGWYVTDSFVSWDKYFGQHISKEAITEKNFNKYLKDSNTFYIKKKGNSDYSWIRKLILDQYSPTAHHS